MIINRRFRGAIPKSLGALSAAGVSNLDLLGGFARADAQRLPTRPARALVCACSCTVVSTATIW
jgi:hypothetical protein